MPTAMTGDDGRDRERAAMTRDEQGVFFERLVELRTASAAAGDDDRTGSVPVDQAVTEAEATFAALRAAEEAALRGLPIETETRDCIDGSGTVR